MGTSMHSLQESAMLRPLSLLFAAVVICGLLPTSPAAAADKPSRILFVTQSAGFKHGSVTRPEGKLAPAEIALTQLGQQTGKFEVDCTQDCAADFTKANLQNYDIVAFYTTLDLPIADEDREYFFKEWLPQKGHGVLGFHSAGDTFHEYEPYWDMMGGTFIGHPWNSNASVTLINHDPENPCVQPFGQDFVIQDEIYMYRHWQPEKVRVLLSLDYARSPTKSDVPTAHGYHVPVCWVKEYGAGRVYYNNLGHNEASWANPAYLKSITNAVAWIRGEVEVDATPNPDVSAAQEAKAANDFAAGDFKQKPPE
ncbi:MAG: ThuA domain-containing protein [Planctomycetaceae bacterium]|nr:ThuA domain-containing protein [Planctomycetaceae bacterium]